MRLQICCQGNITVRQVQIQSRPTALPSSTFFPIYGVECKMLPHITFYVVWRHDCLFSMARFCFEENNVNSAF